MKAKNDFQAQRNVLKSLGEGGPGSTRWGGHTPAAPVSVLGSPGRAKSSRDYARDQAFTNSANKHGLRNAVDRLNKARHVRAARTERKAALANTKKATQELRPRKATPRKVRLTAKDKHDAYTSLGLTRVKGALGGTYYEQRQALKALAEGGPGSTRWGDRTPKEKEEQGKYLRRKLARQDAATIDPGKEAKIAKRLARVDRAMALNRVKAAADENSWRTFGSRLMNIRNKKAAEIKKARASKSVVAHLDSVAAKLGWKKA